MSSFTIDVNGKRHTVDVDPATPLLWVLRDHLGLLGTKFACGIGLCGTCTVLVDGAPERSCDLAISTLGGRRVTTIEGLSSPLARTLQEAWVSERVSQCGYCQPGQIMSAAALLAKNPHPTDAEIDEAMSANLCRCGTYLRIRRAIRRVAG